MTKDEAYKQIMKHWIDYYVNKFLERKLTFDRDLMFITLKWRNNSLVFNILKWFSFKWKILDTWYDFEIFIQRYKELWPKTKQDF